MIIWDCIKENTISKTDEVELEIPNYITCKDMIKIGDSIVEGFGVDINEFLKDYRSHVQNYVFGGFHLDYKKEEEKDNMEKKMKLSEFIEKYGDCEITEDMEKMIKPKKKIWKWRPTESHEVYYYIDHWGTIRLGNYCENEYHNNIIETFRVFKTKDEVKRYYEIKKAFDEASFEPDWNENQLKHFYKYDLFNKRLLIDGVTYSCVGDIYYFKSRKICENLIDVYGEKDICKYILGVDLDCE